MSNSFLITEKLTQQWTSLDREYSLEEQGLKLMIKTDNELKIEKQKKNPYECWELSLFGKKIPPNYFLYGDVNNFIAMRYKFILQYYIKIICVRFYFFFILQMCLGQMFECKRRHTYSGRLDNAE